MFFNQLSSASALIISLVVFTCSVDAGIDIVYTAPVCASSGGEVVMSCPDSYAIYEVVIARETEGACGWKETTTLGCSVPRSESRDLLDVVNVGYTAARACQTISGEFFLSPQNHFKICVVK